MAAASIADATAPLAAAAPAAGRAGSHRRSLLLLRFGVPNLVGFALLLVGLARAAREALRVSRELNELEAWPAAALGSRVSAYMRATRDVAGGAARATLAAATRMRLAQKTAPVRHVAGWPPARRHGGAQGVPAPLGPAARRAARAGEGGGRAERGAARHAAALRASLGGRERRFYAQPQPAPPEKPPGQPGGGATVYERPGQEA